MKSVLTDPVILISTGIVVFSFLFLYWAIRKLWGNKTPAAPAPGEGLEAPAAVTDDFTASDLGIYREPPAPAAAAPAAGKEMTERLDDMTLRLAEMQSVLTKQASSPVPAGAASSTGFGQGFSPETIDKLLKIIGNVIQQVDILQKSLNLTKETPPSTQTTPVAKVITPGSVPNNP
jgi:hypothetical protein